jgi:hypothetical protein
MSMIVRGNEITIKRGSRSVFVGKRDGDAKGVYLKFTNKGADTFLHLSQEAAVALRALLDNDNILGTPTIYETPDEPEPEPEWVIVEEEEKLIAELKAKLDAAVAKNKGETPCKPKRPKAKRRPAKS